MPAVISGPLGTGKWAAAAGVWLQHAATHPRGETASTTTSCLSAVLASCDNHGTNLRVHAAVSHHEHETEDAARATTIFVLPRISEASASSRCRGTGWPAPGWLLACRQKLDGMSSAVSRLLRQRVDVRFEAAARRRRAVAATPSATRPSALTAASPTAAPTGVTGVMPFDAAGWLRRGGGRRRAGLALYNAAWRAPVLLELCAFKSAPSLVRAKSAAHGWLGWAPDRRRLCYAGEPPTALSPATSASTSASRIRAALDDIEA